MSKNITRTGIFEDSIRLMLAGGEVCAAFEEVAREHHAFARLGSLTRSGDLFTVEISEDETCERLDIGKPCRDGKSV